MPRQGIVRRDQGEPARRTQIKPTTVEPIASGEWSWSSEPLSRQPARRPAAVTASTISLACPIRVSCRPLAVDPQPKTDGVIQKIDARTITTNSHAHHSNSRHHRNVRDRHRLDEQQSDARPSEHGPVTSE